MRYSTGDNLDRIEAEARAKLDKPYVRFVYLSPEEALALVEIARAAQPFLAYTTGQVLLVNPQQCAALATAFARLDTKEGT